MNQLVAFLKEEDGIGVVEIILILVVIFTKRDICISCTLCIYRLKI